MSDEVDIVKRLRKNFAKKYPAWVIQGEAAVEIVKLRAKLAERGTE